MKLYMVSACCALSSSSSSSLIASCVLLAAALAALASSRAMRSCPLSSSASVSITITFSFRATFSFCRPLILWWYSQTSFSVQNFFPSSPGSPPSSLPVESYSNVFFWGLLLAPGDGDRPEKRGLRGGELEADFFPEVGDAEQDCSTSSLTLNKAACCVAALATLAELVTLATEPLRVALEALRMASMVSSAGGRAQTDTMQLLPQLPLVPGYEYRLWIIVDNVVVV